MASPGFQPGDLIGGRYRLMRLIGAGAMGAVWSARNESTDRDFALKLMLPDAATNPVALQRFFQEAKASGRLRHRCIVEVYDLGRIEQLAGKPPDPHVGTPYIVMELLEGEPLDGVLRRAKYLPAGTVLKLIADVARGLDVAHHQRIIHRDLKPGNLFLHKTLEGSFVPKILDFGISKLVGPHFDPIATSAGTVLGSPAYMSPEQASGEIDVDARSDVWSLGVILYKCLCGSVPFAAANYNALMMAITRQTPQPIGERVPGLPAEVQTIVDKCLAKDRAQRYASAKQLAEDLELVLKTSAIEVISLDTIVTTPTELSPDDAKTIARTISADERAALLTERSAGTLAATEVDDDSVPTRAIESSSHQAAPGLGAPAAITQEKTAPRPAAALRGKRSWMAIAAVAAALFVFGGIAIARRTPSGDDKAPTHPLAPLAAPTESATEVVHAQPSAAPPPVVASAAPVPSGSTGETGAATKLAAAPAATPKPTSAPKTYAPKTTKGSTSKPDTKSVHEGVTNSGL